MKLKKLLKNIIKILLKHGLWILARDKELFLPYKQFPWFKDKTINLIWKVP